jgi:SulP family sulfate permease
MIKKNLKNFKWIVPSKGSISTDVFSGLTVALALIPEAIAFAFVAGISPIIGLYGALMMAIVTSIIGGRPGMISGAAGALAVVTVHLVKEGNAVNPDIEGAGLQYLFITLLLVGVFQILAGVFKLGKFVRLIPYPVILGFVNGIAILIFVAQLQMFKDYIFSEQGFRIWDPIKGTFISEWMSGSNLLIMLGLVAATMLLMFLIPKIHQKIPGGLVAIILVSVTVVSLEIPTKNIGDFVKLNSIEGVEKQFSEDEIVVFKTNHQEFEPLPPVDKSQTTVKAGLPSFAVPKVPFNLGTFYLILPYALILAAIGLIESLMTMNVVDELTETRGNGNKECVAQGTANIVNGFFGGMGGCAMIAQSIVNIKSGGRGRLSGVVAGISLLLFIVFGSSYIEMMPLAALIGVMFMVVIGTFAWSSLKILNKIPFTDAIVIITVTSLTVIADLAIAVFVGVIISALSFAWENALKIRARKKIKEDGSLVYEIWGPLFFGSTNNFTRKFDPKNDPSMVEIDFMDCRVSDHSGVQAISDLADKYTKNNKILTLKHLSPECKMLLIKANTKFEDMIETSIDDPRYYVVIDKMY